METNEIANRQDSTILTREEIEAKQLTEEIKSTTVVLYALVQEAYTKKVWKTLGYKSWAAYVESEFSFGRVRSYQLLNQAKVIDGISEVVGEKYYITERQARDLVNKLPSVIKNITNKINNGVDKKLAVEEAIKMEQPTLVDYGQDLLPSEKYHGANQQGYGQYKQNPNNDYPDDNDFQKPPYQGDSYTGTSTAKLTVASSSLVDVLDVIESLPASDEMTQELMKKSTMSPLDTQLLILKIHDTVDWLQDIVAELERR